MTANSSDMGFMANVNCYGMVIASANTSSSRGGKILFQSEESTLEETLGSVYIGARMLKEREL